MTSSIISQTKQQGANPTHYITVGGDDMTGEFKEAEVTFSADSGSSGASMVFTKDMRDYQNAEVELWLGYNDDNVRYFTGTLMRPQHVFHTNASVYGPFQLMAEQTLDEDRNLRLLDLDVVLREMVGLAGFPNGVVEIKQARGKVLDGDDLFFTMDSTLLETARACMEKFNFVDVDQPGRRRVFMPEPSLVATGRTQARYTFGTVLRGGLEINPNEDIAYSKVRVIIRSENGGVFYKAERKLPRMKYATKHNATYYITDFSGTSSEADYECFEMARSLRAGMYSFGMSILPNYELNLYDGVEMEHRDGFTYKGYINDSIVTRYKVGNRNNPGEASMGVSGRALRKYLEGQV